MPPHLSSPAQLNAITATAKEPDIPPHFMVHMEIQRQVVQYSTALAGDVNPSTASTLLNLFNNELDNLISLFKEFWSPRHEIQLLGAKLYLFSLFLTIASKRRSLGHEAASSYPSDQTRFSVQLGLPSAVSLIHTIAQTQKDLSQELSRVKHYPKPYFRLVVFAVGFLMKFLSANPKAAREDRELAISHITVAHQFFASLSVWSDFADVVRIIEMWANNLREERDDDSDPIGTRSGASLLYDIANKFKDPTPQEEQGKSAPIEEKGKQGSSEDNLTSAPTSLVGADTIPTTWTQFGNYNDLAAFPPGLDDGFVEGFQWMSDEALSEIYKF